MSNNLKSFTGQTVWIIGASSGIGLELSKVLRAKGARLILSARRKEELTRLASPNDICLPLDIGDSGLVNEAVKTALENKVDRVIIMSATYEPGPITGITEKNIQDSLRINIGGPIHLVSELLKGAKKETKKNKWLQIALCGSVTAYNGLPNAQPYSATKAALLSFAESLHAESPNWIDVKIISPGFVATPMTAKNDFAMPFIINADVAANKIASGLTQRSFEIRFPFPTVFLLKFLSLLPYGLRLFLTRQLSS